MSDSLLLCSEPPATPPESGASGAAKFCFRYIHPRRPARFYDVSIAFPDAHTPLRYRLDVRDAGQAAGHMPPESTSPLSSGHLNVWQLQAAVRLLPLAAHIVEHDAAKPVAGRTLYAGWCSSALHKRGEPLVADTPALMPA